MRSTSVRLLVALLVVPIVLIAVTRSSSQEPPPVAPRTSSVAFVDVQAIMERSRAVKEVLDIMDRAMADEVRVIQEKEARFSSVRFEFERQADLLVREEREKRRLELGELRDEIDRLKFELDRKWKAGERQIEPLLEKIMEVVADVAVRDGYDVVVRGEIVIYGRDSSNLTAAVVTELDARSPEVVEMFRNLTPLAPPTPTAEETPAATETPAEPQQPREILPAIP
jgi:Skp family chaperone for outer membrane proteins